MGETREIVRRNDLRVFDAVAAVARAIGFEDGCENVERLAIGAVADGVKINLEAGFIALDGHGSKLIGIDGENSARGRIIGIRR